MKRKFIVKAISAFMAMLFVFQVLPVNVVAQGSTDLVNGAVPAANSFDTHNKKAEGKGAIVSEVTELREEFVKHFKCDDGTYMAVVYGEPVHYKKDGKWKEIDNTLTLSSPADGKAEYTTISSNTPVSIPQALSDGQKIQISRDNFTVGFGVNAGNKGVNLGKKAEITDINKIEEKALPVTDAQKVEAANAEKTAVKNSSSAVTYSGVFPGADLEYIVSPSKVKENIIINECGQEYVYKFDMDFGGLVPVKCNDGSIELVENGKSEPVFVIQSPYMYDANGETCYDVTMTLSGNTLTVKADSAWINDAERALPVVIDPTYYWYSNTSGGLTDTKVTSIYPTHNCNNVDSLNTGNNAYFRTRSYFKLTMPDLGENMYIESADFNLFQFSYTDLNNSVDAYLNIYDLNGYSSWSSSDITWNNQPVSTTENSYASNTPEDSEVLVRTYNCQYTFSITDMVQGWYEDSTQNNGFMLATSDESQYKESAFHSQEYSTQSLRPAFTIEYRDFWGKDTTTDINGNVTDFYIYAGEKKLTESLTYSGGNTLPSSIVDSNGNTSYYGYDETTELPESITTGGITINYEYNSSELLSEVSQNVSGLSNGTAIEIDYTYDMNDRLSSISHNNFNYNFTYDAEGKNTAVNVGTQPLAGYTYDTSGYLDSITYGNDHQVSYDYDSDGNVTDINYLFGGVMYSVYTYTYDSEGNLDSATDGFRQTITYFGDNGSYEVCDANSSDILYSVEYDEDGNKTAEICGENFSTIYNDEEFNSQTGSTTYSSSLSYFDTSLERDTVYDYFGRRISNSATSYDESSNEIITCETEIGYNDTATTAGTNVVAYDTTVSDNSTELNGLSFSYEYDGRGNITAIYNTTALPQALYARYEYDDANQLIREDNVLQNKSATYTYDKGGNIVSKSEYAFTTGTLGAATDTIGYAYDTVWKDKLTSYDGTSITYDEIGNPLTCGDKQYTWMGRELVGYGDQNEDEYYYFQYNADGLRTLKREAYDTYENDYVYTWSDDGTLLGYSVNNEDPAEMDVDVWIIYDENNEAVGFTANQKNVEDPESFIFYYVKNAQGDVIRVVDENGETMVDYNYDAWGKFTITPGQNIWNAVVIYMFNPVTYRGYYYDPDLKLYYLQSRYYNPEWGRFLNADDVESLSGTFLDINVYSYAGNNPTMYIDIDGREPFAGFGVFFRALGTYTMLLKACIAAGVAITFPNITGKVVDASFSQTTFYLNAVEADAIELAASLAISFTIGYLAATVFGSTIVGAVTGFLTKFGLSSNAADTLVNGVLEHYVDNLNIFSDVKKGNYTITMAAFSDENQSNYVVTNHYIYVLKGPKGSSLKGVIYDTSDD